MLPATTLDPRGPATPDTHASRAVSGCANPRATTRCHLPPRSPTEGVSNRRSRMHLTMLVRLRRALSGGTPLFDPIRTRRNAQRAKPHEQCTLRIAPSRRLGDQETGSRRKWRDVPGRWEKPVSSPAHGAYRKRATCATDEGLGSWQHDQAISRNARWSAPPEMGGRWTAQPSKCAVRALCRAVQRQCRTKGAVSEKR